MEALAIFGPLSDTALLLGLSTTRVAVAFLLVPLFTAELIPPLVRNAIFLSIALLTLLVAAPALVLLYVVEGVLGLVNRFAQQLNVFSLAMSLKAVAATWIIWVQLVTLTQLLQDALFSRHGVALQALRRLIAG